MENRTATRTRLKLTWAIILLALVYARPSVLHAAINCTGNVCCVAEGTDMCETYELDGYCGFVCQAKGGTGGSAALCVEGSGQDILCCECQGTLD